MALMNRVDDLGLGIEGHRKSSTFDLWNEQLLNHDTEASPGSPRLT